MDMKLQHHVNISPEQGTWFRCEEAHVDAGNLAFNPAFGQPYRFIDANSARPHVAFLRLKTDADLATFVRKWGPLYIGGTGFQPTVSQPVSDYWKFHTWFKRFVALLAAVRTGKGERTALLELVKSKPGEELGGPSVPDYEYFLGVWSKTKDVGAWIQAASTPRLRAAIQFALTFTELVPRASVGVRWNRNRAEIFTFAHIRNLDEALRWMLWCDEWRKKPVGLCLECGKAFQGESAHARLYCTVECAHRVAARNHARRKRKESR